MTQIAKDQLKSVIERVERLEEDKKVVSDDIKEVYAEAKANGFDTKIIKRVVALRKLDKHEREEQDAITNVYLSALGMLPDDNTD